MKSSSTMHSRLQQQRQQQHRHQNISTTSSSATARPHHSETSFTTTDRLIKLEIECQALRQENDVLKFHLNSLLESSTNNDDGNDDENRNNNQKQQHQMLLITTRNKELEEKNKALTHQLVVLEAEAKSTAESFSELMQEHSAVVDALEAEKIRNKQLMMTKAKIQQHTNNHATSHEADNDDGSGAGGVSTAVLQKQHHLAIEELEQTIRIKTQQVQSSVAEAERHRAAWEHSRRTAEERGTKLREVEKKLQEATALSERLQNEIDTHKCEVKPAEVIVRELTVEEQQEIEKERRSKFEAEIQLERQEERKKFERILKYDYVPVESFNDVERTAKSLQQDVNKYESELIRLQEQNRDLSSDLSHVKQEYEHSSSRVSVLTADNTILREQSGSLREKLRQVQDDFDVFRSHMGRVTQQRDSQAKEIQQLRNEIFQLKKVSSANQALVTAAWRAMPATSNNNNDVNLNHSSQQQQQNGGATEEQEENDSADASQVEADHNDNNNKHYMKRETSMISTSSSLKQQNQHHPSTSATARAPSSTSTKNNSSNAKQMARMLVDAALGVPNQQQQQRRPSSATQRTPVKNYQHQSQSSRSTTSHNNNNNNNASALQISDELLKVSPQTPRPENNNNNVTSTTNNTSGPSISKKMVF